MGLEQRTGSDEGEAAATGELSGCAACLCTILKNPTPVPMAGPSIATRNIAELGLRDPGRVWAVESGMVLAVQAHEWPPLLSYFTLTGTNVWLQSQVTLGEYELG